MKGDKYRPNNHTQLLTLVLAYCTVFVFKIYVAVLEVLVVICCNLSTGNLLVVN